MKSSTKSLVGLALVIFAITIMRQYFVGKLVENASNTSPARHSPPVTSISHASKQDGAEIITVNGRLDITDLPSDKQLTFDVVSYGKAVYMIPKGNTLIELPNGNRVEKALIHKGDELKLLPKYASSKQFFTGISFECIDSTPVEILITYSTPTH